MFDGADLRRVFVGNTRFERCRFEGTKIHDWGADEAEIVDCMFATRISESRFAGRPWKGPVSPARERNEFQGNDFSRSTLVGNSFVYGIAISERVWPEGPDYIRLDRYQERLALAGRRSAAGRRARSGKKRRSR